MTRIIRIDPSNLSFESLIPAVELMGAGSVVAYPTETFYGLGTQALNEDSVRRIYAIKKRSFSQALPIIIPSREALPQYVKDIPAPASKLIDRYWPGSLTLIFSASHSLSSLLCAGTGKVAIRISSHPIAQALAEGIHAPLTATSANISGAATPTTAEEVANQLGDTVDLIIDGGRTAGAKPSTMVDVTLSPPQLIREGAIPFREIEALLGLQ